MNYQKSWVLLASALLGACNVFTAPTPPGPATGTDPTTTLTGGPRARTRLTTGSFQLSSEAGNGATFQCSLDAEMFAPCGPQVTREGLRAGAHLFRAYAVLPNGLFDKTPAAHAWEVITTPLDTSIVSAPAPVTSSTSVQITFAASDDDATFECSLNDAPFAACPKTHTVSDLTSGVYRLRVRAVDPDGVRDETPAEVSWRVDTESPAVTITQAPPDIVEDPQVTVLFQANKENTRLLCRLDDAAYAVCASPHTITGLRPGPHQFSVLAEDLLGVRSTPATAAFTVQWRLGVGCSAASDCRSGFCRDGVCCDEACAGTCRSCGLQRGTCTTVRNAIDLDSCSGDNSCDDNGTCGPRSTDPTFDGFEFATGSYRFRGNFPAGRIQLEGAQYRFDGRIGVQR